VKKNFFKRRIGKKKKNIHEKSPSHGEGKKRMSERRGDEKTKRFRLGPALTMGRDLVWGGGGVSKSNGGLAIKN